MAYSSGPSMSNATIPAVFGVFESDKLSSRQLFVLQSYIDNSSRIPGWTPNPDDLSTEELQLLVAFERYRLEQKRAAHNLAEKKKRKHRQSAKRGHVKSSIPPSEPSNGVPSLIADANFGSVRQSAPSPLLANSLHRDQQYSRDVSYRFNQAAPPVPGAIVAGCNQMFFMGGLLNSFVKILLWQFILQAYFIQHVIVLLSRN